MEPGLIEIRTPGGDVRFTTKEPMFHVTDNVSGSYFVDFPFNPATSPFERIQSYALRSGLNPAATHVFGVLRTGNDSYGRLPGGTWFDAGGTYLHRQHWWSSNANGSFDEAIQMRHTVLYTFRVEGGTLWLDEDVRFADYNTGGLQSQLPVSLSSFTITFKLKVGLFT